MAAIELREVAKRFGAKRAVDSVSFSVEEGACFGLIGPNGAGKTTCFSMVCGFLFPTRGQIRVMGVDPTEPGSLRGRVGVLPQDAILPGQPRVGPLLEYWGKLSGLPKPRAEAERVLAQVGLSDAWGTWPPALSHGMAKRVAMAQALMGTPPVVLLDEPTAGLDPKIAAQIRGIIHEMRGKQTVVVSSHNLNELEALCDAAAILDRGRLVQVGSITDLTARSGEVRIEVGRGDVPLDAVRDLKGCLTAGMGANGVLVVTFDRPADEMITEILGLLIAKGVRILGVQRGRGLEERVLELT